MLRISAADVVAHCILAPHHKRKAQEKPNPVLQIVWVSVLDAREVLDTNLITLGLPVADAVHIGHENARMCFVFLQANDNSQQCSMSSLKLLPARVLRLLLAHAAGSL